MLKFHINDVKPLVRGVKSTQTFSRWIHALLRGKKNLPGEKDMNHSNNTPHPDKNREV